MHIPADVPASHKDLYIKNIQTLTKKTEHIFLLAGDQKIEHLNTDFYGPGIHPDAAHPEHLFKIAAASPIGAFATHVGLIAQYGLDYPNIPYIAKLNGKTDLIDKAYYADTQSKPDPVSRQLWNVHDVVTLQKNANLNIIGVGYTIYLGSKFEQIMLHEAAQTIMHAHQNGLIAILWIYPRGKAIQEDNTVELLAGAAGLANTLGADVVKLKTPKERPELSIMEQFHIINEAAGTTKVIYAGGSKIDSQTFLEKISLYIQGSIAGVAVGRNIFQHSLSDAIAITNAIAKIVYKTL
jgi:DhnA family fructose-bisphosphate aldolase class Ia